jgi:hypothetical protein
MFVGTSIGIFTILFVGASHTNRKLPK